MRKVAVLWSSLFPENASISESARRSASELRIQVFMRQVQGLLDLEPAFLDAVRAQAQGIVFLTDNILFGHRRVSPTSPWLTSSLRYTRLAHPAW
jgi:hypothetical protein